MNFVFRKQTSMRLGFLAGADPEDFSNWSGTPSFAFRALKARSKVLPVRWAAGEILMRSMRRAFRPFHMDGGREFIVGKAFRWKLRKQLSELKPDILIAMANSSEACQIAAETPVVHCADSTFRAMLDYYPGYFSNLSKRAIRIGDAVERMMIERARILLYSSEWAADSAIKDYSADPKKLFIVPFGANLVDYPATDPFNCDSDFSVCRLLFVGVDWARKGGDVALNVLKELLRRGVNAELHVVGCQPPDYVDIPAVKRHGFLRKDNANNRQRLTTLFSKAAFLLVPSQQEAYGIVFCEASAYGLPSLGTRTGGIPTIVKDGVNGFTFDLNANPGEYAKKIDEYWNDHDKYAALRRSTKQRSQTCLTWDSWGNKVIEILNNHLY